MSADQTVRLLLNRGMSLFRLAESRTVWCCLPMKRSVNMLAGSVALVLTSAGLFALSDVPEQYAKWRVIIALVPDPMRDVAASAFGWVLFASIMIAAAWLMIVVYRLVCAIIPRLVIVFSAMRGVLGMSELITRTEALAIIEASDFFAVRSGGTDAGASAVAALFRHRRPNRDVIIHNRFRERILQSFADQRPASVQGEGYVRADLIDWLNALIDREVDKEMGSIPSV